MSDGECCYSIVPITAPAIEPLELDELKEHLRKTDNDEDAYLLGLIRKATRYWEGKLSRRLIQQTMDVYYDFTPMGARLELPVAPVSSVTYVKSYSIDDTLVTMDAATYAVDLYATPQRLILRAGQAWPSGLRDYNAMVVRLVVGYGTTAGSVPSQIRGGLMWTVAHWYENREPLAETVGERSQVPLALSAMMDPYRVIWM
jgi:uncharacterized phiE125 gp8 family phage protein